MSVKRTYIVVYSIRRGEVLAQFEEVLRGYECVRLNPSAVILQSERDYFEVEHYLTEMLEDGDELFFMGFKFPFLAHGAPQIQEWLRRKKKL